VQALRDLVAAKERYLGVARARYEAGMANKGELVDAEIDLTEARIRLAEAEGDQAGIVARLQQLVDQRREARDLTAQLVEVGRVLHDALDQADARLADAKARLARAAPPRK
jgi:outer membrane protein TolC